METEQARGNRQTKPNITWPCLLHHFSHKSNNLELWGGWSLSHLPLGSDHLRRLPVIGGLTQRHSQPYTLTSTPVA